MTLDGIIKGTHLAIPSNSNIKFGCKINKKIRRIQIIWQQNSKMYMLVSKFSQLNNNLIFIWLKLPVREG